MAVENSPDILGRPQARVGHIFIWVGQAKVWVGHGLPGLGLEPPLARRLLDKFNSLVVKRPSVRLNIVRLVSSTLIAEGSATGFGSRSGSRFCHCQCRLSSLSKPESAFRQASPTLSNPIPAFHHHSATGSRSRHDVNLYTGFRFFTGSEAGRRKAGRGS